jgi:hypothetical protein
MTCMPLSACISCSFPLCTVAVNRASEHVAIPTASLYAYVSCTFSRGGDGPRGDIPDRIVRHSGSRVWVWVWGRGVGIGGFFSLGWVEVAWVANRGRGTGLYGAVCADRYAISPSALMERMSGVQ